MGEKLKPFYGRVQAVYYNKTPKTEGESRFNVLLVSLRGATTEFHSIEDSQIAAEAEGWLDLIKSGKGLEVANELYEET